MADPSKYTPNYSFVGYQTANPADPLPAPQIDNEYALIAASLGSAVDAIKDVRRSDGALKNNSVGPDQLSATFSIGFTLKGTWTSGVAYSQGDGVTYGTSFYKAAVSHTAAGPTRPDLDPVTWIFLFVLTSSTTPADGSITQPKMDPTYDGSLARVNSQAFTGTPTAPTAAPGTNTMQLATTAFVSAAFTALAAGVSGAYDTLNEIVTDLVGRWNATVVAAFGVKTPVDADLFVGLNSASGNAGTTYSLTGLKSALKAYFDPIYQAISTRLTALVTLLGTVASGDILYGSGAATLARLAKGTDGQFLSLVSGLPAWGAAPGMTLLGTLNATGVNVQNLSGLTLTGYNRLYIELEGLTGSGGGNCQMNISSDAGSTFDTAVTIGGLNSALLGSGFALLSAPGITSPKQLRGAYGGVNDILSAYSTKTGAINYLRFTATAGNFNGGAIKVWGEK